MAFSNTTDGTITITQGDSGYLPIELCEDDEITPLNIDGITAIFAVSRISTNAKGEEVIAPPIITKTIGDGLAFATREVTEVIDGVSATRTAQFLDVTFNPIDTAKTNPAWEYMYEVQLNDGAGFVLSFPKLSFIVESQLIKG